MKKIQKIEYIIIRNMSLCSTKQSKSPKTLCSFLLNYLKNRIIFVTIAPMENFICSFLIGDFPEGRQCWDLRGVFLWI